MGAEKVWGMDIDDVAVKVAIENVRLNGLEDKIIIKAGDIVEEIKEYKPDIVLANITPK